MSTTRREPMPERDPAQPAPGEHGAGTGGEPDGPLDLDLLSTSPFDDDLEEELAARPPRARPGLTLCLGAAVVAVAGFIAGIQANRSWGDEDSSSRLPAGAAAGAARGQAGGQARPGGGQGAMGGLGGRQAGRGQAGGGGVTAGTVQKVSGDTIYLRTTNGEVVKVTTSGSTKVRVTKDGSLGDLKNGASVVVQGTPGQDGTMAATNIAEGGALGGFRQRMGGGGGTP